MTLSADTFAFVANLVRRRSAIDLIAGKENLVESRLEPLARQAGLTGGSTSTCVACAWRRMASNTIASSRR